MILASVLAAVILLAGGPAVVAKGAGVIQKSAERKLQRGSKVIAGFELIHAATGQTIVTLVNGTVIDMSTLVPRMTVPSFSIRAVVSRGAAVSASNTVSIEFPISFMSTRRRPMPVVAVPEQMSFTIKRGGSSKVPVKAPVKAPVKKPVQAPLKVPVKAPKSNGPACRDTLIQQFNSISHSGRRLSLEGTTPEDFALQWLYYNDTTIVPAQTKPCSDVQLFRLRQRFALLTLWFQQTTTRATTGIAKTARSTFWDWDAAWLKGDECDMDEAPLYPTPAVSCTSIDLGGSIGRQNVVTSIDITRRGLHGTLPPDLAHLSHIKYFLASDNDFGGTIPSSWASWTDLADFDLNHNALTGTLPTPALSKWTNLVEFFVTNNDLTGTLPTEMGLWSNLLRIYVGQNRLYGTLPTHIGNWKLLQFVDVSANAFSGTLPTILKQWTNLMRLDASNNQLTGTLSGPSLMQWTTASGFSSYFNVSHNRLSGTLPTELAAWKSMKTFWIANNQFSGTIPSQLATAWRGIFDASFLNTSLVSGVDSNGDKVDMPLCAVHNVFGNVMYNKAIFAECQVTCSCCLDRDQCN